MNELHLLAVIVFNGAQARLSDPSGRQEIAQIARMVRRGTYCRYERGVVIFRPELTVECPRVFLDRAGHRHVEAQ